ncbi:ABC transporter permease [Granulicella tundricola]|uniref:Binding-protein-dependent transport systems inner membrane component n=1 Tax=Granulicella tundricola (strain ATCC BAA-1859 / DSM 23138 / MP5ACTX9) TaxID=1198114 RepID=E8WVE9_GRATM|nr:ABC transporter permease subunit [Granulicella tundricola]ADW68397.1 binding-protein-dependent transport systems inner membrane component [Granulicella tundricola MP5ACTX9]
MISLPTNLPTRETLARSQVLRRSWPFVMDLAVAVIGLAVFYCIVLIAKFWAGPPNTQMVVSLSPRALPAYAFYSVVRIGLAYLLSLAFAIAYGYTAAYNTRIEPFMIAVLDILQSIPVLSFLPGVMLAMVGLFPTRHLGVELGAIVLIFTGAVWNMAFSFYSSLKSIPRELIEATRVYRYSPFQRLVQLELPYAAIGLLWNSIMSVAGAWFFLMACEMFHFRSQDFRLPGLGSYLQTAADQGNGHAIAWGLFTMVAIIVATDQLLWRPLIAWSDKFKFEQVESSKRVASPILALLTQSNALTALKEHTTEPLTEYVYTRYAERRIAILKRQEGRPPAAPSKSANLLAYALIAIAAVVVLYLARQTLILISPLQRSQYLELLKGAAATFGRVNLSLALAAAWTIPVGVAIGFHPRLARIAQPLAQIAASVPATALFPVILLALVRIGGGLGIGSIALMLLGTQWYILFNVIAGALAIPTDLKEVATLFHFSTLQRWKTVILPGIFPFLITGMVTASGGAWNASIIAEYFRLNNQTLQTVGLGAMISNATEQGQFPILLLGTVMISLMVVTTNRLVWRPLFRLAETRYRLGA